MWGCVDNLDTETKYRISPFNIDRSLTNILTYILWSDILFLQTLFYNLSVMPNKIKISIWNIFFILPKLFLLCKKILLFSIFKTRKFQVYCAVVSYTIRFVFCSSWRDLEDFSWSDWKMELSSWWAAAYILDDFQSVESFPNLLHIFQLDLDLIISGLQS